MGSPTFLRPPSVTLGQRRKLAFRQPLHYQLRAGRGHGGTGISTSCASTTPLGLALAPDLPWED
jgi:hypothetical protein